MMNEVTAEQIANLKPGTMFRQVRENLPPSKLFHAQHQGKFFLVCSIPEDGYVFGMGHRDLKTNKIIGADDSFVVTQHGEAQ